MSDERGFYPNVFSEYIDRIYNVKFVAIGNEIQAFNEKYNQLIEAGVWKGTALKNNYDLFKELQVKVQSFYDGFQETFDSALNKIAQYADQLESGNLGDSGALLNGLKKPTYVKITLKDFEQLINLEGAVYNVGELNSYANEMATILEAYNQSVDGFFNYLLDTWNVLNTCGFCFQSIKDEALNIKAQLSQIISSIKDSYLTVINNLRTGASNAENA